MSNEWGIEDNSNLDGNNTLPGPKALRDAYEAQKTKTKELEDSLASIQRELTQQKVSATLTELGIPAAAAEQYKGEANPEKVREWATTMQGIFGGGSGQPNTPTPVGNEPATTLPGDAARQYQQMNEAGQQGTPLGNAEMAQANVNDATDLQGLLNAWKQVG